MKKHIFIVEDDSDISELIQIVVEGEGFTTETFLTLDNVESAAAKTKPALIIMDLTVGGEDGAQTVKKLKNHKETSKIPVMLVSAKNNLPDIAKESKSDDYLAKPFNLQDLVKKLKKFV